MVLYGMEMVMVWNGDSYGMEWRWSWYGVEVVMVWNGGGHGMEMVMVWNGDGHGMEWRWLWYVWSWFITLQAILVTNLFVVST